LGLCLTGACHDATAFCCRRNAVQDEKASRRDAIDSLCHLGHYFRMAVSKSPDESSSGDDTALLIAALNRAWTWYDARMNRGLQVVNYYLVASAVLATAYVSAINGRHYAIAAVIALSEVVVTGSTFMVGYRQRRHATGGELALIELQSRIADRLGMGSIQMLEPRSRPIPIYISVWIAFGLAVLLSIGGALYALVHLSILLGYYTDVQ
jgi:hypothetical protein